MSAKAPWVIRATCLIVAVVAVSAEPALAQASTPPPDPASHNRIIDAFAAQARTWQAVLRSSAIYLFFALATIQFVWSNMSLALKGASLGDVMESNVRFLLGTGVMYAFLIHSYDWMRVIVMSFRQAGERAIMASAPGAAGNEAGLDPSFVFSNGLIIAGSLFSAMSANPLQAFANLPLAICAILIIVCFAFLAAFMAVAIIESFIVIGGAVLLLGFGGSSWTADIAKRTLMYAVSVGAKLFVMQLVVGAAMGIIIPLARAFNPSESTDLLALIGIVFFTVVLAKTIPDLVQGLLNGVSTTGMGAPLATAAAITAAAGAGAMAIGGAAKGAVLGNTAAGAAGGAGGTPLLSSDALNTARMAGHLANAGGAGDVNRTLGGIGIGLSQRADHAPGPPVVVPPKPDLPPTPADAAASPPIPSIRGSGAPPASPSAVPPTPAAGSAASPNPSADAAARDDSPTSARSDTAASAPNGSASPQPPDGPLSRATSEAPEPSRSVASSDAPPPTPTPSSSTARQRYQAAGPLGTVGLVAAGPAGLVAGVAAGLALGPQIAVAQARARAALDAAKTRFGITAPKEII